MQNEGNGMLLIEYKDDYKNCLHLISSVSAIITLGLLTNYLYNLRIVFLKCNDEPFGCNLPSNIILYGIISALFICVSSVLTYKYLKVSVDWHRIWGKDSISFTSASDMIDDILKLYITDYSRVLLVFIMYALLIAKDIVLAGKFVDFSYIPGNDFVVILVLSICIFVLEYPSYILRKLYIRHKFAIKDVSKADINFDDNIVKMDF